MPKWKMGGSPTNSSGLKRLRMWRWCERFVDFFFYKYIVVEAITAMA